MRITWVRNEHSRVAASTYGHLKGTGCSWVHQPGWSNFRSGPLPLSDAKRPRWPSAACWHAEFLCTPGRWRAFRRRRSAGDFCVPCRLEQSSGVYLCAGLDFATAPLTLCCAILTLLGACVPQPGVAQRLETLTVWPMWRLQFRNFGTHEAMVVNHTVDANGRDLAGIRWYELRRTAGGAWSIFQQGTHAPDREHRWMGSIAMDGNGNIALGYSVSSGTVFPGIRRTGRLVSDPPGTMTQPEATIIAGGGAQTHPSRRYGNYSSMDVDPVDDCTFWYTTEYYASTSAAGWRTRITSFRNPECKVPPSGEKLDQQYAAKMVCGLQKDPDSMQLVRGFYGTAINIHNPGEKPVVFTKKLALTFPPREQKPGKIIPIAKHVLAPDEALEVDCDDVRKEAFGGQFPELFIKGFIVIESESELDVTAVYTAAGLDPDSKVTSVTSIDVDRVLGRRPQGRVSVRI